MTSRKVAVTAVASACLLVATAIWFRKEPMPSAERLARPVAAPLLDGDAYVIEAPWHLAPDLQHLRVPKAYLWLGGSQFEGNRGKRVIVEYELPSRSPVQKPRPAGW